MDCTLKAWLDRFDVKLPEQPTSRPIDIFDATRADLAGLFAEMGYRVGAEIGVEAGRFSEIICDSNPGVSLYCVDPWRAYEGYVDYKLQPKLDRFHEEARRRLAPYDAQLIPGFSMDVVRLFPPESLDFAYIDGNHSFDYVVLDVVEWSKRVRPGGIVAGHDFVRRDVACDYGVVKAVNSYAQAHRIFPWFTIGGAEGPRSWFWVKERD